MGAGIKEQTGRVFENIKGMLEEAGSSLDKVTKVNVYLKDAAHFKEMNAVYASKFGGHKPARSTVATTLLHEEFLLMVDAIAEV